VLRCCIPDWFDGQVVRRVEAVSSSRAAAAAAAKFVRKLEEKNNQLLHRKNDERTCESLRATVFTFSTITFYVARNSL
jgi:hypothetical protein